MSTLKAIDEELVKSLVEERFNARSSGDFKKADEIRDKLLSMGILNKRFGRKDYLGL